jgi:protein AroM
VSRPLIAAVTIGQTPRPDLVEPLLSRAGGDTSIVEFGALDELTADRIPRRASRSDTGMNRYPLTTRLRDASLVTVDEDDLAPLVQAAVDRAERSGADVVLLLCAGGFLAVRAVGTLVRPFEAAVRRAGDVGARSVAVVVPYPGQARAAERKWQAAGFDARAIVGDVATIELPPDQAGDAIVLDYVGHPVRAVAALRARVQVPVIDLGECGADAAVTALAAAQPAGPAAGR